jgi:hypothetical protein
LIPLFTVALRRRAKKQLPVDDRQPKSSDDDKEYS